MNKALTLLKKELDEIPNLRKVSQNRVNYELWVEKVSNILELAFGKNSREYDNFARAVSSWHTVYTEEEKRKQYYDELDAYEIALKSAIHKCELLLDEEEISVQNKEKHYEVFGDKEGRKNLLGTPEEIAPHIVRIAESLKIEEGKYKIVEEINNSTQFSKRLRIMYGRNVDLPTINIDGSSHDREDIGIITLQSLPNNETLFIPERLSSNLDSNGVYLNNFLERLSLEFKNLGIEETKTKKTWRWVNKILDIWAKVKP